ncbi:MAG: hypothetical protein ACJATI_000549 [Halioglobus sp.]
MTELTYDTLGVYLRNEPLSYDGERRTIPNNKKYGIVKTSVYSAWTDDGQG